MLRARGDDQAALFAVARQARDVAFGPTAVVRGVIEISSVCVRNCLYCPMRADNRDRRYVAREDDIRKSAADIRALNIGVVFLQSGEAPGMTAIAGRLLDDIRGMFDHEVEMLLCLGAKSREDLAFLRGRGGDGYVLKQETADPSLHRAMRQAPLEERLDCARTLVDLGYRLGLGTIVGLPGQSLDSLADDILLPGTMGARMVSASPFVPAAGTPLGREPAGDLETTLNVIALTRLLYPDALIPAVSALERRARGGQLRGFSAGANVITVNFTPPEDRARYAIYGSDRFVVRFDHAMGVLAEAGLAPRLGTDAFSFWRSRASARSYDDNCGGLAAR